MTVRASFTFRNQGGAVATGVRVRFNLPEGLVYLVGSGQLDGVELDDEQGNSPLLSRAGADIGDVAPGQERRIDIAYSVAGAIENGSTVELQAAVAAFELAPVGSNVVRLVAHSRPALENPMTNAAVEARGEAHPGSEATVTVRVHNAGESSAHDLVIVAPVPEHTTYVPNSVRVNGRDLERDLLAPFDRVHAPVVAATLPASATATLQYRVRIDDPLDDGTAIVARVQIASQETRAFALAPAALTVRAQPNFDGERTSFTIDPAHGVTPGSRVTLRLSAYNAGTTAASGAAVAFALPEGLIPVRGAARVDGRPIRDRNKKEALIFDLGTIPARETAELVTEATVASPMPPDTTLPVTATLRWDGAGTPGERAFEQNVTVASHPYFSPRRNRIALAGSAIVKPSDECEASIVLNNDGSAAATAAVLHLRVDPGLEDVRVLDKNAKLPLENGSVELEPIEPYASRRLTVRARVRTPHPDRSELRLSASLQTEELGETPLGDVTWRVDSHPAFSSEGSGLQLVADDVFRPNQLVDVIVRLRNEGTDAAQNVRLRLLVSPEARIESIEGATRERSTLLFGEIAPGSSVEARLGMRLLRSLARAYPVTVESVLSADAMLPVQLPPLTVVTTAEPNFTVGTLHSEPGDAVDAGEEVEYVLHVRNSGDGPARSARISVEVIESLIYVPNSTTVNDLPVRDTGAQSPLTSERGIVLTDVDPGVEATIRWREVVHNGLVSGEAIVRTARVSYDGDRTDEICAHELKVRCAPAFANTISGLPFGLDGMLGPAFGGGQRAIAAAEGFLELPPATPVTAVRSEVSPTAVLSLATSGNGVMHDDGIIETIAVFDRERLERALKFLSEARFGALVTHLFAIRALFPSAAGSEEGNALHAVRESLRETLDRMFIKLRLPNYVLAPRDVETAAGRAAVETLVSCVQPGHNEPPEGAAAVLRGSCDPEELHALRDRLLDAPLATSLPWATLARFLPDDSDALRHYRTLLATSLDDLAAVDETAFIDALQRRPYPVLDASLDVVRTQLTSVRT